MGLIEIFKPTKTKLILFLTCTFIFTFSLVWSLYLTSLVIRYYSLSQEYVILHYIKYIKVCRSSYLDENVTNHEIASKVEEVETKEREVRESAFIPIAILYTITFPSSYLISLPTEEIASNFNLFYYNFIWLKNADLFFSLTPIYFVQWYVFSSLINYVLDNFECCYVIRRTS